MVPFEAVGSALVLRSGCLGSDCLSSTADRLGGDTDHEVRANEFEIRTSGAELSKKRIRGEPFPIGRGRRNALTVLLECRVSGVRLYLCFSGALTKVGERYTQFVAVGLDAVDGVIEGPQLSAHIVEPRR
ncbi:MAG: hypothetical protein ACRDZV_00475 [Acidimicrobiia bacterium]